MRHGRPSMIERGCFPGSRGKRSASARNSWNGGTRLRPDPRSPRHAQGLVAWPAERAEALCDPRCRYNLGLIMRLLTRAGTPWELQALAFGLLFTIVEPNRRLIVVMLVAVGNQSAAFAVSFRPDPLG